MSGCGRCWELLVDGWKDGGRCLEFGLHRSFGCWVGLCSPLASKIPPLRPTLPSPFPATCLAPFLVLSGPWNRTTLLSTPPPFSCFQLRFSLRFENFTLLLWKTRLLLHPPPCRWLCLLIRYGWVSFAAHWELVGWLCIIDDYLTHMSQVTREPPRREGAATGSPWRRYFNL